VDPDAAPIWVQYGHMLKESGALSQARDAYESALRLSPANADTHLQLGHLLKVLRKNTSAIEMYAKALELDPQLRDAERELRSLGGESQVHRVHGSSAAIAKTYFDISDLIYYFGLNRGPGGIQRVVIAMTEAAVRFETQSIGICAVDEDAAVWKAVDPPELADLLELSRIGSHPNDPVWVSGIAKMRRSIAAAAPLVFPDGSTIVAPGAPWDVPDYFPAVREAKRQSGLRYVAFIHDLVPIFFPEYCEIVRPPDFMRWVSNVVTSADLVIANSHNTRRDFERLLEKFSLAPIRCEVVQPNGDLRELCDAIEGSAISIPGVPKRYVLCVGTIEPRKNHLLLLRAWRHLVRELGADNVPTLVIVGRYGWSCENTREFLVKTANVEGKITVLNDVEDALLPSLYKGAEFTIYNSHYEGWGLPVTESLCFGKVPLVARNSGLIESGGSHAIYFETGSEPSLVGAVRDVLLNPDTLTRTEAAINTGPISRSWAEIVAQTRDLITTLPPPNEDAQAAAPVLELGQFYIAGHGNHFAADVTAFGTLDEIRKSYLAESFRRRSEWHAAEGWGVWSRSKTFEISLTLPPDRADEISDSGSDDLILYVHVLGHREICNAFWEINGTRVLSLPVRENEEKLLRFAVHRDSYQKNPIVLRCIQGELCKLEKHDPGDKRVVGIGLRSMMLCREDDMAARMRMMEFAAGFIMVDARRRTMSFTSR
jgi:glycosyltransferase involved in cell wall biosynthesis